MIENFQSQKINYELLIGEVETCKLKLQYE